MLYQALTARLPFSGKFFEVMMNKQTFDPPAPTELVRNVPPDLNDLCVRLLRRKPDERPQGREILRILGHGKTGPLQRAIVSTPAPSQLQSAPFVGRAKQLRELEDAFAFTRRGQTAVIGEMVAGILLGPSLFGLLAPNAFHFIFAASSLEALRLLSPIGVPFSV